MAFIPGSRLEIDGEARPRAVVVAVQLPDVTDGELASSIEELARLGRTLGLEVVGRVLQRRAKLAPGVVLGEGKLRELARWTGGSGVVEPYARPGRRRREASAGEVEAEGDAEGEAEADSAGEGGEAAGDAEVTAEGGEIALAGDGAPSGGAGVEVVLVGHDLTPTHRD